MGYTISYNHRRKGFASEILSALIELLHEKYPYQEFICLVYPKNIASIDLLKKLGYLCMGYEKKSNSKIYGKWIRDKDILSKLQSSLVVELKAIENCKSFGKKVEHDLVGVVYPSGIKIEKKRLVHIMDIY